MTQDRYRVLIDQMNDLMVEFDRDMRVLFANSSFREAFDCTSGEVIGTDFGERFHPLDAARIKSSLEGIHLPPHKSAWEVRARIHGRDKWFAWSSRAVVDSSGTVRSVISVGRDITEYKSAEYRLRRSEQQLRDLVNSISDLVYTQDLEGRFLSLNPSMLKALGYGPTEEALLLGRPASDFMKPKYKPLFRKEYLEHIRKLGYHEGVSQYFKKDGSIIFLEYRSVLVHPMDGDPYISGLGRDITEKRAAEKKIAQLQDQMLQSKKMEAIGTLAGGIAHDFNNLLMGIQGTASLMLLDTPSSHPHHEKLKFIEQYVKSGADLTRQLLGFARGGKYEVKPIDLNQLVRQSAEMFGRTRKEILIEYSLQEDLWPVEADRSQMEQILLNLYVNAWHAMPSGGVLKLVTENVELTNHDVLPHRLEPGRYAKILVCDTGEGMDPDTRDRIFEPFFTSKGLGRGTGLGLASVYGIVKNHGGFILVSSEPGKGSTFSIHLPATSRALSPESAHTGRDADVGSGSGTILLVDDEKIVLEVGAEMLQRLGYHVLKAPDGQQALDLYTRHGEKIHLVILDMIMPGMGGGEVFDRLRAMNPTVKVLLSSGYSVDGQAQAILDRGCDGFIQKPFDLTALSTIVSEIISRSFPMSR